jgi:hypothetical protein
MNLFNECKYNFFMGKFYKGKKKIIENFSVKKSVLMTKIFYKITYICP